jgi:hypothetical protein
MKKIGQAVHAINAFAFETPVAALLVKAMQQQVQSVTHPKFKMNKYFLYDTIRKGGLGK